MESKKETIKILKPFLPLLKKAYTYYVYASGRGCGKSENIIICLLLLATQSKIRILCIREFQTTINESVKANIEKWIEKLNLSHFFISTNTEIKGINGSLFIFRGMRSTNAVNIKSISDIDITFIEEGEAFSEKSWEILVPSVMRGENKKNIIVIAFNPNYEEDVIYDRFFIKDPPKDSYICKLTQKDNPFFFNTDLANQMAHDKKILPHSQFAHKWLGELNTLSEDCLFTEASFKLMKTSKELWHRNEYIRLVIGVDPATTNKDFSNQFGICVVGITKDGEYHCLANHTDNYSPYSFAMKANELYLQYKADAIVIETNAGGDFLKSTLLTYSSFLNIIEVRATKDKMTRALPIANLASLGKIKILEYGRAQLLRQMKNSTLKGYKGPTGESPDALDALCWAIYELGQLLDKEQSETIFKLNMFKENQNDFTIPINDISYFTYYNETEATLLSYEILDNKKTEHYIKIISYEVLDIKNYFLTINKLANDYIIFSPLNNNFHIDNTYQYEAENLTIDELVSQSIQYLLKLNIDISKIKSSTYKSFNGNILQNELLKFKLDSQKDNIIIRTFCYFLKELANS